MGFYKISKIVLGSLLKGPATRLYPQVPRIWQEGTRGHVDIYAPACILCGICVKKCPTNAIAVSRDQRTWAIERMQCIQCANCVEACPKKCLQMEPEYTTPDTKKTVDSVSVPEQPKPEAKPTGAPEAAAGSGA